MRPDVETARAARLACRGTVAPTGADVLDAGKLAEWMSANVEGFEGPVEVLKFAGGQSNPTYRLNAKSGSYVLRRKPFGKLLPSVGLAARLAGEPARIAIEALEASQLRGLGH